jgi:hypothetical protein
MITSNPEHVVPELEALLKPTLGEKAAGALKAAVPTITSRTTALEEPSLYQEE